jgi:hypothetical protein
MSTFTATTTLVSGAAVVTPLVSVTDISGGALVLYSATGGLLAAFATGQWKYVVQVPTV